MKERKIMKKWLCFMMTALLCAMALAACGNSNGQQESVSAQGQEEAGGTGQIPEEDAAEPEAEAQEDAAESGAKTQEDAAGSEAKVQENAAESGAKSQQEAEAEDSGEQEASGSTEEQAGKVLVAYYSASGNTKAVGDVIAQYTGGDVFEIIPVNAYTSEDLDWTEEGSRVNQEHEDESLQDIELVSTTVDNLDSYDTIFIGYPIWWQEAAWVVNNFVKGNDFTGKTVIPFCTSSSSGLGESGTHLAEMAGTGDWQEGRRFSSSASEDEVTGWLAGLGF